MEMYETIAQAVDICARTWHGRKYRIVHRISGKLLIGSAYDIYGEATACELFGKEADYCPIDRDKAEDWALIDTIYAVVGKRLPPTGSGYKALQLLNKIVAEAEGVGR